MERRHSETFEIALGEQDGMRRSSDVVASLARAAQSAELRFLCACIGWPPSPERDAAIRARAAAVRDWPAFLALARRHRVEIPIARALRRLELDVPEAVRGPLGAAAKRQEIQSALMGAAACEIHKALCDEDIQVVTLKGAPLGVIAFGDPAMRQVRDVDLLVQPDDFAHAAAVMRRLGYRRTLPAESAGPRLLRLWQRLRKDHTFQRGRILVEFHWRATENPFLLQLPWDSRSWRKIPVGSGCQLNALGPQDMFAYLCIHGAVTGWHRLKWLADVAALLAQETPETIGVLFDAALARGAGRAAGQAMLLCGALLDTVIPATVRQRLAADRATVRLAEVALYALLQDGVTERSMRGFATLRPALLRLSLSPSMRFKLREIVLGIANPSEAADAEFSDSLMFLYPVLRVFVWLGKHISLVASRRRAA